MLTLFLKHTIIVTIIRSHCTVLIHKQVIFWQENCLAVINDKQLQLQKDDKWLFSSLACLHQNHSVEHFESNTKNESLILEVFDPRM